MLLVNHGLGNASGLVLVVPSLRGANLGKTQISEVDRAALGSACWVLHLSPAPWNLVVLMFVAEV